MKITLTSFSLKNNSGGVERFSNLLYKYLTDEKHEVTIVSPEFSPLKKVLLKPLYWTGLLSWFTVRKLSKKVADTSPDLVISQGYMNVNTTSAHIHVYHGTMVGQMKATRDLMPGYVALRQALSYGLLEKRAGRNSTNIAVSPSTKLEVEQYYKNTVDYVIPNGVDTNIFKKKLSKNEARKILGLPQNKKYLLYIGRAEAAKGTETIKKIAAEKEWTILVAGSKEIPGTHYLGLLSTKQLAIAYNAADCVFFPSNYEACSYVVLEALASKTPIATTDCGYIPEIINNVPNFNKFIFDKDHMEDIKNTLDFIFSEDQKVQQITEDAYAFLMKECSLQQNMTKWLSIVHKLTKSSQK